MYINDLAGEICQIIEDNDEATWECALYHYRVSYEDGAIVLAFIKEDYSPEYNGGTGEDIELVSHRCEMLRVKCSLECYTNLVISFMNNKDCFEASYDIKLGNVRFEPVV